MVGALTARTLVLRWLREAGITTATAKAKTVSFADLARGSGVFVTVRGWPAGRSADDLKAFARANGFFVMVEG